MYNFLDLVDQGRVGDLFIISRFCYKVGNPILSDSDYELILEFVKSTSILVDYIDRSYDDDPLPLSLIKEFKLDALLTNSNKYFDKYDKSIEDEKSISIRAIENYKEAFDYRMSTLGKDKNLTPKINGINLKSAYTRELEDSEEDLTFKIGKSRGRNGDGFNFTRNLSRIIPNSLDIKVDKLLLFGESYVTMDAIGNLVSPSGLPMKVERSAAMSMLRTDYKDGDYKYLKYKIFRCEGLTDSSYESLTMLRECGLDVVPILNFKDSDIPTEFEKFCKWLKDKLDYFNSLCEAESMPTDGVVFDVDEIEYTGNVNGQYSDKNVALKFEYWSHKYYQGVVKDIEIKQRGSKCSVTAIMHPVVTDDRCLARRVTLYSPAIMMRLGIQPGSKIYFKRDSGVISKLIYGNELKELLGGSIYVV